MTQVYTNSDTFTGGLWVDSTTVGGNARVSNQTASSSAAINFTSMTGSLYLLVFYNVVPVTDGAVLRFQMSNDNGSTYISTSYEAGITYSAYNTSTFANANSTAGVNLADAVDNGGAGRAVSGQLLIGNLNAAVPPTFCGNSTFPQNIGGNIMAMGTIGGLGGSTGMNAGRVLFSTGNISTGTFKLYQLA